jgi:hypothetical protein
MSINISVNRRYIVDGKEYRSEEEMPAPSARP